MSFDSKSSKPAENKTIPGWKIVQNACLSTNKYFFKLIGDISFVLILSVCVFVANWLWYIKLFGVDHIIVKVFSIFMYLSLSVVVLFMISLCLFNRTHPEEQKLKFWAFTKEITYPWLWEGLKASGIIFLGFILFIIPGLIKNVQYMFFSFVVFFDPDYKAKKVSALKRSKELSKGLGWWILGLAVLLPFLIQAVPGFFLKGLLKINSFWILYPVLVVYVYIISLFFTYLFSVLYFMYEYQKSKTLNKGC